MDCQKEAFIYKAGLTVLFLLIILFSVCFNSVTMAQDYIDYEIQKGDCLWTIAKQFQLSIQEIAKTNDIDVNKTLQPGLLLKIPQDESISDNLLEHDSIVIHTVQKGESLWDIAQQYHSSLELLSKVNELKEPNSLYIGQEVKVPVSDNALIKEANSLADGKTAMLSFQEEKSNLKEITTSLNLEFRESVKEIDYVVKPGESLWTIAQNYHVSLNDLSQVNDLENAERLTIGQIIKIPLGDRQADKDKTNLDEQKKPQESSIEHIVLNGETISTIAQKYHTSVDTICQLNRMTAKDYIFPGQRLKIKVNEQDLSEIVLIQEKELEDNTVQSIAVQPSVSESVYYTVKSGDSLSAIAQQHGVSVEGIVAVNYLTNKDRLSVGQQLKIPAIGGNNLKTKVVEYTVAKGDTLSKIAQKFNIRMYDIISLNELQNVNRLSVGQKLNIPASAQASEQGASSTSVAQSSTQRQDTIHYVQKGDTLWQICRQYDISLQSITSANSISENSRLTVGQRLVIPNARGGVSGSSPSFTWPVNGLITSHFGTRTLGGRSDYHTGIDIDGHTGNPIRAAESGKVSFCGSISGYGKTVIIDHAAGYSTVYAHNSENLVSTGQSVQKGEVIARLGATGNATGSHLHFEVRVNSKPVNPLNYLP